MKGQQIRQHLLWGGAAVVTVAILSMAAAYAPAAVRKIGLFSIAFGAVVGWTLARLNREFGSPGRAVRGVIGILIVAGLVNTALQSHRLFREARERQAKQDPEGALTLRLLKSAADDDPEAAAVYRSYRREVRPTFADYLASRVAGLGEWPQPWPIVFWITEMALATAAGVWVAKQCSHHAPRDGASVE